MFFRSFFGVFFIVFTGIVAISCQKWDSQPPIQREKSGINEYSVTIRVVGEGSARAVLGRNGDEIGCCSCDPCPENCCCESGFCSKISEGSTIILMSKPIEGHKFSGWIVEDAHGFFASYSTSSEVKFTMPAVDVVVTAEFSLE